MKEYLIPGAMLVMYLIVFVYQIRRDKKADHLHARSEAKKEYDRFKRRIGQQIDELEDRVETHGNLIESFKRVLIMWLSKQGENPREYGLL